MAEFVVNVLEVERSGGKSYDFPVRGAWLVAALADTDFDAARDAEGTLHVAARKAGADVLLEGRLTTRIVVPCARCNEALAWPVEVDFTHFLSPRAEHLPLAEELELTPEDLDRDYFVGDAIELDGLVREHVLLSVPMQPMHDESDCDPQVLQRLRDAAGRKPASPLAALAALKDKAGK